ncbi:hypothetical protein V6N13_071476 [Hibiscus sabdariffa]
MTGVMKGSVLVTSILGMINMEWRVVVNHIGRDRNRVADMLASWGRGMAMTPKSSLMSHVNIASLVDELLGYSPTTIAHLIDEAEATFDPGEVD